MLLAPCKRHSLHREFTPEPAPQRHCTFGPHLLLLRLSSSLVSGGLALSTPARNTHTFACHKTKPSFRRTESCPSNGKHTHPNYFNSSNNKTTWGPGGSCQVMCNVDSISHLQGAPEQCGHKLVHSNYSCSWGSLPPTADKD